MTKRCARTGSCRSLVSRRSFHFNHDFFHLDRNLKKYIFLCWICCVGLRRFCKNSVNTQNWLHLPSLCRPQSRAEPEPVWRWQFPVRGSSRAAEVPHGRAVHRAADRLVPKPGQGHRPLLQTGATTQRFMQDTSRDYFCGLRPSNGLYLLQQGHLGQWQFCPEWLPGGTFSFLLNPLDLSPESIR